MALDGLTSTIRRIKSTISEHQEILKKSEMTTRYALIDPMLRSLEWDTTDPAQVRPEFQYDRSGRVDYVLLREGKPQALLEAKGLGQALDGRAVDQAFSYALRTNIGHIIVSDGSHWRLYDAYKRAELEEKVITEFNVSRDDTHEVALKALYMWRPNLTGLVTAPPKAAAPASTTAAVADPYPGGSWCPIREVLDGFQPRAKPPTGMRLPDGSEARLSHWKDVLVKVATWMADSDLITGTSEIAQQGRGNRNLVSPRRRHAGGKLFLSPKPIGHGNFVETHFSAPDVLRRSIFLLRDRGQDLGAVYLRFDGR